MSHPAKNCTARECAVDILRAYFSDEVAEYLLWEETCFPMSCEVASEQAHALIDRDLRTMMAL